MDVLATVTQELSKVQVIAPSDKFQLALVEHGLLAVDEEAERRVEIKYQGIELTGLQIQAATAAERLSVLSDMEYILDTEKAATLREIEAGDLWSAHPSSPTELDELIRAHGMSPGEASELRAWYWTIFPWLETHLNLKTYEIWKRLGKSKMRRLTPIFRALLGTSTKHSAKVDQSLSQFQEQVEKDIIGAEVQHSIERNETELDKEVTQQVDTLGEIDSDTQLKLMQRFLDENPEWKDENKTQVAVRILEVAESASFRDLEEGLKPSHTPPIQFHIVERQGHEIDQETGEVSAESVYHAEANLSEDQFELLRLRFRDGRAVISVQKG